jgi:hypothetical protein
MMTYGLLVAAFMVAAALAAVPAALILRKLGISHYWALLVFAILCTTPFIPGYVVNYLPATFVTSLPLPVLGGILKVIEWAPGLIFLWAVALYRVPKKRASKA